MLSLSEAIRLGAMLKPQCFGRLYWSNGKSFRSCALAAAMDAVGVTSLARMGIVFPILDTPVYYEGIGAGSLCVIIGRLNDGLRMSREEIASWVAIIEELEPIEASPAEVVALEEAVTR